MIRNNRSRSIQSPIVVTFIAKSFQRSQSSIQSADEAAVTHMAKPGAGLKDADQAVAGTTNSATVIQRVTYSLGGQPVVVRVTGDPAATNNGLFYLHTDHLGSVSALSRTNGTLKADSHARYTPFGDWRTEPGTNPALTDRGYTGHRHNNSPTGSADDLGLNIHAGPLVRARRGPLCQRRYACARYGRPAVL